MQTSPNRLLSQRADSAGAKLTRNTAVDSASRLKTRDATTRDAPTALGGTPPTAGDDTITW